MPDKTTRCLAWLLLLSGMGHLCLWLCSGQVWEGAVSLRKPALFGISGGMTVWSLGWVLRNLPRKRSDVVWAPLVAWALVAEVALITLQYWRGVPSHFNHATAWDALIERVMLTLILLVTGIIGWMCIRMLAPLRLSPAMALALRGGMALLLLSCLLGIGATVLGQWNLMQGKPHELWGKAGVLKFPHGIALHAIQLLPVCAWLFDHWRIPRAEVLIKGLLVSQWFALVFASWQTWQGRARFDMDVVGLVMLIAAMLSATVPIMWSVAHRGFRATSSVINQ